MMVVTMTMTIMIMMFDATWTGACVLRHDHALQFNSDNLTNS